MIAMFKLFYNTIAACQRPVGPLLSNKCNVIWHELLLFDAKERVKTHNLLQLLKQQTEVSV